MCKRTFTNSTLIGSPAEISKKIGISEHLTRTYLNYGLKNSLIVKFKGNYVLTSYDDIIEHIEVITYKKYYHFSKTGTFPELVDQILFEIANVNFKRQRYHINQRKKLKRSYLPTAKRQHLMKSYSSVGAKHVDAVVTGQKHLAKVLGVSQKKANDLLIYWNMTGRIIRRKIYKMISNVKSKAIYRSIVNQYGYCLDKRSYSICLGTQVW